jgi:hypothetical protein
VDEHDVPQADSNDSPLTHQPYIATTSTTHAYNGSPPRTESTLNGTRWQPDASEQNNQPRYVNNQALDHSNDMALPGESALWSHISDAFGMEPFSPGYRQLQASDAPRNSLPLSPSENLPFLHQPTLPDYMQDTWPQMQMDHIDPG